MHRAARTNPMLSLATISLLAMATVMAILVGAASRALLRPVGTGPSQLSLRDPQHPLPGDGARSA